MSEQKKRMIAGELYRPGDAELVKDRATAQRFMRLYNVTTVEDGVYRRPLLASHLGALGDRIAVRAPLYVDYGYNIFLADDVFLNYGCVLLDVCPIRIGEKTQIGPGVQLYAADHPREAKEREAGYECGAPITIGKNVWIGGHAIVLPGITIGDNAVVGAGSIVTRDVSANVTVVRKSSNPNALRSDTEPTQDRHITVSLFNQRRCSAASRQYHQCSVLFEQRTA